VVTPFFRRGAADGQRHHDALDADPQNGNPALGRAPEARMCIRIVESRCLIVARGMISVHTKRHIDQLLPQYIPAPPSIYMRSPGATRIKPGI
jgi:hypothetical protein